MKGYKIFNSDWTCLDMQYTVGKTHRVHGHPIMCERGFHFCREAVDCTGYYPLLPNNRYAEVRAVGQVISCGDKCVTNVLDVVREISYEEFVKMCRPRDTYTLWPNGNVQKKVSRFKEGCLVTTYREDGSLHIEDRRVDSKKGEVIEYYSSGEKCSLDTFARGVRNGPHTEWRKDGTVHFQSVFKDGITVPGSLQLYRRDGVILTP